MKNLKYIAIGILVGYLAPYLIAFIKSQRGDNITFRHTYEEENEEEK